MRKDKFEITWQNFKDNKISKEQFKECMRELGHDPDYMVKEFEWEQQDAEKQVLRDQMKNYRKDLIGATKAAFIMLGKYGSSRGWPKMSEEEIEALKKEDWSEEGNS